MANRIFHLSVSRERSKNVKPAAIAREIFNNWQNAILLGDFLLDALDNNLDFSDSR